MTIEGVTINAAWQMRMEDKIGSIEVGKYADLVILEKNLFDVEPGDMNEVKVIATMMDGQYTFEAKDGNASQVRPYSKEMQLASTEFFHKFYCGGDHSAHEHGESL